MPLCTKYRDNSPSCIQKPRSKPNYPTTICQQGREKLLYVIWLEPTDNKRKMIVVQTQQRRGIRTTQSKEVVLPPPRCVFGWFSVWVWGNQLGILRLDVGLTWCCELGVSLTWCCDLGFYSWFDWFGVLNWVWVWFDVVIWGFFLGLIWCCLDLLFIWICYLSQLVCCLISGFDVHLISWVWC